MSITGHCLAARSSTSSPFGRDDGRVSLHELPAAAGSAYSTLEIVPTADSSSPRATQSSVRGQRYRRAVTPCSAISAATADRRSTRRCRRSRTSCFVKTGTLDDTSRFNRCSSLVRHEAELGCARIGCADDRARRLSTSRILRHGRPHARLVRTAASCRAASELASRHTLSALNRSAVDGVATTQASLHDFAGVRPAFDGQDVVVHLAAKIHDGVGWDALLETNVVGTRNVFQASVEAGVRRVVFASSGAVVAGCELESPYVQLPRTVGCRCARVMTGCSPCEITKCRAIDCHLPALR